MGLSTFAGITPVRGPLQNNTGTGAADLTGESGLGELLHVVGDERIGIERARRTAGRRVGPALARH